jgi:hypothetical protein
MPSNTVTPSPDTLRTHQPGWRGCGSLVALPDWPTGGVCGEVGVICMDCHRGDLVAPDVGELVELCTRIQQNAHAIPVRVNLAGKWESKYLSELPAELAVWWALQFILRRLLGPSVDETPAERFAAAAAQPLELPPAAPASASITVDVAEVAGARVVKLVLPAGVESIAVALAPDTADALARTLAQQARIARSPAGLILPRS